MRKRQKKKITNRPTSVYATCVRTDIASGIIVDFKDKKIVLVDDYAYTFQNIYDATNSLWKKNGKGSCPLTHLRYINGHSMFKPITISHTLRKWSKEIGSKNSAV